MNLLSFSRGGVFTAMIAAVSTLVPAMPVSADPSAPPAVSSVRDGAYLTGGAGKCMDCHGVGLHGAPFHGPPEFAKYAPSLVGLPMFKTDADAIHFFMTTEMPDGGHALPPMPRYMFNREDAAAIVTYLRGLK